MNFVLSRFRALGPLFVVTVVAPTLIASIYFGVFATNTYLSESQFVVRSPEKGAATGFGALLQSTGFGAAGDEVYLAQSFLVSRDALAALNKGGKFQQAFQGPGISIFDRFDPLGWNGSFEDLFEYFEGKILIEQDSSTSVTKLVVRAYTPEDAHNFNSQLLELAERTVNRINARGRQDLIGFAQSEVDEAESESRRAAAALAKFRNQEGVVDPERQATAQLQMVSKLQDALITDRTMLAELQRSAPRNPQVDALRTRIRVLSGLIDEELSKAAGGQRSLSSTAVQYQRLLLDSQFAEKQLGAAMASLIEAQNEARRKHAYVERIVQPNKPDNPLEPRRIRGIVATLVLGLVAWAILSMLLAGLREHRD